MLFRSINNLILAAKHPFFAWGFSWNELYQNSKTAYLLWQPHEYIFPLLTKGKVITSENGCNITYLFCCLPPWCCIPITLCSTKKQLWSPINQIIDEETQKTGETEDFIYNITFQCEKIWHCGTLMHFSSSCMKYECFLKRIIWRCMYK
jgi:hypothetical protein